MRIADIKFAPGELGYIRSAIRESMRATEYTLRRLRELPGDRDCKVIEVALAIERGILAKFDEQEKNLREDIGRLKRGR